MIPKIIHYVWVGGPLPEARKAFISSWRITNPDFELVLWNEDNIDFSIPIVRWAYDSRRWATVADIVRLIVVAKHGGIYLDTDFMLFKSLNSLLQHRCFYGFQLTTASSDWVANGAFGSAPGHWFVEQALPRTLAARSPVPKFSRPTAFGPKLITKLLRENGLTHYSSAGVYVKDVFLLPTQVFYPFSWNEKFHEDCISEETLGAHFWAESEGCQPTWVSSLPVTIRAIRKFRRAMQIGRACS